MSAEPARQPGSPEVQDLARLAVRGTLLSYLAFAASKLIAFVSILALTRLLAPREFGLVAYGLAVLQYLDILTTAGTTGAVIAARQRVQETANSAFILSVGAGVGLYGVAWLAAPVLARFFDAPNLVAVFRALALALPLAGLGAVPNAVLQRALDFRAKVIVDVTSSALKAVVAIALAVGGFGVWSLVAGQLVSEATSAAVGWLLTRWRPTTAWDRVAFREMARIGWHIVCVGLAGALVSNVDYLIVGRALGTAALGYYTLAYRVPELLLTSFNWVIGRVSFPVLVSSSADARAVRAFYFAYVRYVTLVAFPAGVGLAMVATTIVVTLFSANWLPSAPVMRLMALSLALSTISHVPGAIYKATAKTAVLNRLTLTKLPLTIACLGYGTRWGILGVAWAQCALAVLHLVLDVTVIHRVMGIAPLVTLRAALPATLASAVMAAGLVGSGIVARAPSWEAVGAAICLGAVLYVGILIAFWPAALRSAWTVLRAAVAGPSAPTPVDPSNLGPQERGVA